MALSWKNLGKAFGLAFVVAALMVQPAAAQTDDETLLREATARSAAVATVLDAPRKTPAERLASVFTLLDLGEVDVAGVLLAPVLQEKLSDKDRAELVEQFGTARFLNLARRDRPADEGAPLAGARQFARRCLQAAAEQARDPQRVAKLVAQLNDPSPDVRNAARVDLAVTGTAGAQACLEALAQETDESRRANLLLALTRLRPEVDPLVLAVLADGAGHLLRDVAELAGHTGMLSAAPFLAAIAVKSQSEPEVVATAQAALVRLGLSPADLTDARGLLNNEIQRLEASEPLRMSVDLLDSTWWIWRPAAQEDGAGELLSVDLSPDAMRAATLERFARTLIACGQANSVDRQLAEIYRLQLPTALLGTNDDNLSNFSLDELSGVLAAAVERNCIVAAIRCAQALGERGDAAALTSFDSRPTPLAQALSHPDRGLRFAALEAVMKIAPQQSFAGASNVPKALWQFVAGAGTPQAVAASLVATRASDWAGQLRSLGYDAIPADTGRGALEAAIRSPRLALVLVDSDIGRPLLREVLYQLRSARTTARVPVAVLSSLPNLDRVQRLEEADPLLLAVARPQSREVLENIVQRLSEKETTLGSSEERLQQAAAALQWIAQLQETGHPYDEFLRESHLANLSLQVPELLEPSLRVLTVLGTADSQRTLVDLATDISAPIETRQQALAAFAKSVERFGKLLTPTQISLQFDRYNASESESRESQQVLGHLLDILEGKKPLVP